jgi:DNA-binding PadR family transcriptional regulator
MVKNESCNHVIEMIRRVKEFRDEVLLATERGFLETFESEILRGISTLAILSVINEYQEEGGTYGYQILKDLEEKTENVLVIEDGTLYPILKKLEREDIVKSENKTISGRKRKYYILTEKGLKIYHHMEGFLTTLIDKIAPLIEIDVILKDDIYLYFPNCANKIDMRDPDINYCPACGYPILQKEDFSNE